MQYATYFNTLHFILAQMGSTPPRNALGASARRPPVAPLARGAGGGPSAPRQAAASARSQAARGTARSGQAAQVKGGWSFRGFFASGPRHGPAGKAGGAGGQSRSRQLPNFLVGGALILKLQ